MMSVTTLRGVYMSPAAPPGMAPASSATMALKSPAMTPYETYPSPRGWSARIP
jgi:hypothetical protein